MEAAAIAAPMHDLLVARARRGDLEALESLFRSLEAPVFTLARRLCGREEAEDVLQETFLEVVRSLPRYRGDGPLGAWVRRIAASKALMRLRRRALARFEALEEDPVHPARPEPLHARLDLETALDRLPPISRAVVWLHDVEGYTHEEIGELLGRTPSFSKSQLARSHARLRALLATEEGACTPLSRS